MGLATRSIVGRHLLMTTIAWPITAQHQYQTCVRMSTPRTHFVKFSAGSACDLTPNQGCFQGSTTSSPRRGCLRIVQVLLRTTWRPQTAKCLSFKYVSITKEF